MTNQMVDKLKSKNVEDIADFMNMEDEDRR